MNSWKLERKGREKSNGMGEGEGGGRIGLAEGCWDGGRRGREGGEGFYRNYRMGEGKQLLG